MRKKWSLLIATAVAASSLTSSMSVFGQEEKVDLIKETTIQLEEEMIKTTTSSAISIEKEVLIDNPLYMNSFESVPNFEAVVGEAMHLKYEEANQRVKIDGNNLGDLIFVDKESPRGLNGEVAVKLDINNIYDARTGVVFRGQDANNFTWVGIEGSSSIRIRENIDGMAKDIIVSGVNLQSGKNILKVEFADDRIIVNINNTVVYDGNRPHVNENTGKMPVEGQIGIMAWAATNTYYDDLQVVYKKEDMTDILNASVRGELQPAQISHEDKAIKFFVSDKVDLTYLEPNFELENGAYLTPGGARDFTEPVIYTVSDGMNSTTWEVSCEVLMPSTIYHNTFDNNGGELETLFADNTQYEYTYDSESGRIHASGNIGNVVKIDSQSPNARDGKVSVVLDIADINNSRTGIVLRGKDSQHFTWVAIESNSTLRIREKNGQVSDDIIVQGLNFASGSNVLEVCYEEDGLIVNVNSIEVYNGQRPLANRAEIVEGKVGLTSWSVTDTYYDDLKSTINRYDYTDILSASVKGETQPAYIDKDKKEITFFLDNQEDISRVEPSFTVLEGASITPLGAMDFSKPQTYTVTYNHEIAGEVSSDWKVSCRQQLAIGNEEISVALDNNYPQVLSYTLKDGSQIIGGSEKNINQIKINGVAYEDTTVHMEKIDSTTAQYTVIINGVDPDGAQSAESRTVRLVYEMSLDGTTITKKLVSLEGDQENVEFTIEFTAPIISVESSMKKAGIAASSTDHFNPQEKIGLLDQVGNFTISNAEFGFVWNDEVSAAIYTPSSFTRGYTAKVSSKGTDKVGEIYENKYYHRLKDGKRPVKENSLNQEEPMMYESKVYLGKDTNNSGEIDWQDTALWVRKQLPQMPSDLRAFFNGGNWHQTHGAFPGSGWAGHASNFKTFTTVYSTPKQLVEVQRQVSNMTDGQGRQTFEYVGWNGMGHDFGWPNINEVYFNPAVGTPESMKQSKLLMEQYGGDLSFHVNMTDMTDNSESYLRGNLESEYGNREASTGAIQYGKDVFGWNAWKMSHYIDLPFALNRQEDFVQKYWAPFVLYQDVMLDYPKSGNTQVEEHYAKMREIDRWRNLGTYAATEYYDAEKRQNGQFIFKNYGGPTTLANFMNAGQAIMHYTRNRTDVRIQDYIWGFLYSDDVRTGDLSVAGDGNQSSVELTKETFLYSLPNGYVAQRKLLGYKQEGSKYTTYWSDGIKWEADSQTGEALLSQDDIIISRLKRERGSEIKITGESFIPRLEEDKILVYSVEGQEKVWLLPESWRNKEALKVYDLTADGSVYVQTVPVVNGKVTVATKPGQAVVLLPVETELSDAVESINIALNAKITASSNTQRGYNQSKYINTGAEDVWIKREESPTNNWDNQLKSLNSSMKNNNGDIRYSKSIIAPFTADGVASSYWQPNIDQQQNPIIDMQDGNAWLEYSFVQQQSISKVRIQEVSGINDKVTSFKIQIEQNGAWEDIYTGEGIPEEAIVLNTVPTNKLRLVITGAKSNAPKIGEVEIYN